MGHLKNFENHIISESSEGKLMLKKTFDNKVKQIATGLKNLSIDLEDLPKIKEAKYGEKDSTIYDSHISEIKDMGKLEADIKAIKAQMNKLIDDLNKL